jgi:CHAT domain-containing protein
MTTPPTVRRILARNDLLTLARDAEGAIGIVRESMTKKRVLKDETELFSEALRLHCDTARKAQVRAIRIRAWDMAGIIVRLCDLLGIRLERPEGIEDLTGFHRNVLAELAQAREVRAGEELDGDLFNAMTTRHRAIRDLRIGGDHQAAIELASLPDNEFVGTGADFYRAEYQAEIGAALLLQGQAAQVRPVLGESEGGYWKAVEASRFTSRHRLDFVLGLAAWAQDDLAEASDRLARSHGYLHETGKRREEYDVEDLLLSLARAELLAVGEHRSASESAVGHLEEGLRITERIRDRWRVISRSRSPLSVAFRRIYGDVARTAAVLPGRPAAELGLRVVLSAKQSGFASRIRADRSEVAKTSFEGRRLRNLIDLVVAAETESAESALGDEATRDVAGGLENLRDQIQEAVSPMLADTVLPAPADVARLIEAVGDRYALDYVELPDTVSGAGAWFRTLIEPDGTLAFDQLVLDGRLAGFLDRLRDPQVALWEILPDVDWWDFGARLLPDRLRRSLGRVTEDEPVELVVSAHSALSLMPWAALRIDERTRLIERAVIAQTPVLSCLSGAVTPPVAGPAVVQLVSGGDGVYVTRERLAWGIRDVDGHVPLCACALEEGSTPVDIAGTLAEALADVARPWGFAHVASHGDGSGLGQALSLPRAPISAGRALTLHWPPAVLMASCHVGRLVNIEDAEPLNFVMAVLAGGGGCVVACIDEVSDVATGRLAAEIVTLARRGDVRLDVALRSAQLRRSWRPEALWALLTAYSR